MGGVRLTHHAVLHLPYHIPWPEMLSPTHFLQLVLSPFAVPRPDTCVQSGEGHTEWSACGLLQGMLGNTTLLKKLIQSQ